MSKEIRESDVEGYLVERVKALGGEVRKVKWIGRNGAPDRLVMLNGAHFIELKRPGEWLEPHQSREHDRMGEQGVSVWVASTFEMVDRVLLEINKRGGMKNLPAGTHG